MLSAGELQSRGRTALNSGQLAKASGLLQRALARSTDDESRAATLLSLAYLRAEQGTYEAGLRLISELLDLRTLTPRTRGLAFSQAGLLHMRAGNQQAALSSLAKAQPLLTSDRAALARLHLNRGNIYLLNGQIPQALGAFAAASRLAVDPIEVAKADHNRGYAEYLHGNLVAGLRLIEGAEQVLGPLSPVYRATVVSDRAEVLSACGMPDEAASALEQAAHAFALRRLRQSQGEAELARARILAVTEPARAVTVARAAARRFRLRGSEDWSLRAEAVALASEVAAGHTGPRIQQDAEATYDLLRGHRLRNDAQVVALSAARAALVLSDTLRARSWVNRARVRDTDSMATRILDREVRAGLAARSGRRTTAFDHLRRGLDDLHEWLSAFGSLDLQSALVGHGRGLATVGLDLAVADGRPEVVFEWFERARVLVSRVTPVQAPPERGAAAELAELRRLQEQGDDASAIRDRIRQHAWYAPSIGPSARPADLAELQGGLDDAALLGLVIADRELYGVVATAQDAEVVPLGPAAAVLSRLPGLGADLDMAAASDLPPGLAPVVRGSLDAQLRTLDAALVRPLLARLGSRPVVVVASGGLSSVPWALLPSLRGRPLSVARSATHWLSGRDEAHHLTRVGLVTGPGVLRAAEEVGRCADAWRSARAESVLDASAEQVSAVAGRVDVLHVAAHGRHSAENPLFSGIELTGGPWFGYDIDQLDAVPSVVVLSACELGRSTVRGGEELVGMTTAWLHAGVRCVVASPAALNDDLACELLPLVHEALAAGRPPAHALAEASDRVTGLAPLACYGSGW